MRIVGNIGKQLRGKAPGMKTSIASSITTPSILFLGLSGIKGLAKMARDGTVITNPWFYSNIHSGYGKRGIDGNNLNTGGLVQSLHNNRRPSRY